MSKKSPENIWKCLPKPLIFAPASREKHLLKRQKQVLKNFWKIFKKDLQIRKKSLPLHPLRLKDRCEWYKKGSDKILKKKSSKKIWNFGNKFLPLQPESTARPIREKVLKNFWKKIFQKDLVVQKITLTFAPLSAEKQRSEPRRRSKDPTRRKERNCSYSNIRTAFFEVFEQLKFSHSLRRVISNNTFEIWAKDL